MKYLRLFCLSAICLLGGYGAVRLYYYVTDGFTLGNITSDLAYNPNWELPPPDEQQWEEIHAVFSQPFTYLAKGCQTYVFISEDRRYVLKFLKYQRFRVKPWIDYLAFLPIISNYREQKLKEKQNNCDQVFKSFCLGYSVLPEETGLLYVHLNKTNHLQTAVRIRDKIGFEHLIDLDPMEFVVQRTATMLCERIRQLVQLNDLEQIKKLFSSIIALELAEYSQGLGDEDYALMQNMGVVADKPIHIDIGQVEYRESLKRPEVAKKHLFNRMFKFHRWLKAHYPFLADDLERELHQTIGDAYLTMKPDPEVRVSL